MAIRAKNIANVNTPGYQASDAAASDVGVRPRTTSSNSTLASSQANNASNTPPSTPNNVDLAKELVGMRNDERTAGYNLKAMKAQDRLTGELLDMVG